MSNSQNASIEDIYTAIRKNLGRVPSAIEASTAVDPELLFEHVRSSGFAMPNEGALDAETRTLIYLAAALAGSNPACVAAMSDKIQTLGIAKDKVIEAIHITRFAMATKIIGDSEPIFRALQNKYD